MSNKLRVPEFQLEKVYSDGSREEPVLHALSGLNVNCHMGRRGFLLTSALGAGALAALSSGCAGASYAPKSSGKPNISLTSNRVNAEFFDQAHAHGGSIYALVFSPDGKLLFSSGTSKAIKIWSIPDGKLLRSLKTEAEATSLAITPDGKRLYAGDGSGIVSFWEAPFTGGRKELGKYSGLASGKICISPDGSLLAVSSAYKKEIQVISLPDGKVLRDLEGPAAFMAFSPDNATLVASGDGKVTLHAVLSGKQIRQWQEYAKALALSADGKTLALRYDYALRLWGIPSGRLIRMEDVSNQGHYFALAFSPDGNWLATDAAESGEKGVLLYRPPFSEQAFFLSGTDEIHRLAFSKDSRWLAASGNRKILVWEMPKSQEAPKFLGSLFDPAATPKDVSVRQANIKGSTFVGPCGSPMPAGAVCTCNCVPGSYAPAPPRGSYYCTCDTICTCVPIK